MEYLTRWTIRKIEQDLITRLKALPGVNTQEMMMELTLRGDLLKTDEAEAAKSLEIVDRHIQDAGERHQAFIDTLAVWEPSAASRKPTCD